MQDPGSDAQRHRQERPKEALVMSDLPLCFLHGVGGEEREAAFVGTAIAGAPWDIRVGPGESGLCPNQVGGGIREHPALLLLWAALLVAFPLSTSLQFVSPTWAHSILFVCFFFVPGPLPSLVEQMD